MTTEIDPLPDFDEVFELRQALSAESDRGCALMAAAYLDSQLERLLMKAFVDDKAVTAGLLGQSGPLGTFSSRIDIAYAMGLLGPKARRDLHLIRKIRNDFGHVPKKIALTDQAIADRCKGLYHDGLDADLPPRKKFTRVVMGVAAAIHARLYSLPTATPHEDLTIDDAAKARYREHMRKMLDALGASRIGPAR